MSSQETKKNRKSDTQKMLDIMYADLKMTLDLNELDLVRKIVMLEILKAKTE